MNEALPVPVRPHATTEEQLEFHAEQTEDVRAKWLEHDTTEEGRNLKGEYLALRKHRVEIAGFAAQEMGVLGDVTILEGKIAARGMELCEAGIETTKDRTLLELHSLLRVASRVCLLKVIDHPLVQRVMEYTHQRMQEIRKQFLRKKKECADILSDSDDVQASLASTESLRHLQVLIRKTIVASTMQMRPEHVPYSSVESPVRPAIGKRFCGPL